MLNQSGVGGGTNPPEQDQIKIVLIRGDLEVIARRNAPAGPDGFWYWRTSSPASFESANSSTTASNSRRNSSPPKRPAGHQNARSLRPPHPTLDPRLRVPDLVRGNLRGRYRRRTNEIVGGASVAGKRVERESTPGWKLTCDCFWMVKAVILGVESGHGPASIAGFSGRCDPSQ